jgi:hypothetical protein
VAIDHHSVIDAQPSGSVEKAVVGPNGGKLDEHQCAANVGGVWPMPGTRPVYEERVGLDPLPGVHHLHKEVANTSLCNSEVRAVFYM